jgi:iron complex transport system substrate-binding protein
MRLVVQPKNGDGLRIISLLPSATEILFAIGAGDEVVGVTHECDYPDQALRLPRLTASAGPDYARPAEIDRHVRESLHAGSSLYSLDRRLLESLRPDLIVTQELCPVCAVSYEVVDAAAKELRTDARIVSLEPSSLRDVFETILLLGRVTNREANARDVVASLEERVAALRDARSVDVPRPRTLVLEWTDPPMSAGHWIPELIELAGGEPVLANPGMDSKRLEWDAVAAADPDAVIVAPCGFDLAKTEAAIAELDTIPHWRSLRANRSGRVLALDGNAYLSRPGPRLVEATELIAEWYAGLEPC